MRTTRIVGHVQRTGESVSLSRRHLACIPVLLFMLLWSSSATAKNGTLLEPAGPYANGRMIFHWRDASRPEALSSKAGEKREVGVWVWYPAIMETGKSKVPYIDQLDALAKALSSREVSLAREV